MEPHGDALMIRPMGELDIATAVEFFSVAMDAARSGSSHVVLDLRELEFCDSTGLRAILELHERIPDGTRFEIIRGPAGIQRLLAVSGAKSVLPLVEVADLDR